MFTHLHGHSTYSFLEAIGRPSKIIEKAKELGMDSIGITDYNGMYSAIRFYQTAQDEGIRPIIGVELGFVLDSKAYITTQQTMRDNSQIGNIILIAQNEEGYQNLMELTSFANKEGITGKPKIDINVLKTYGNGLIAVMGGRKSRISHILASDSQESKIIEIIKMIQDAIGADNVYLDIIAQDYKVLSELKNINDQILDLSKQLNLKCLVHNNYHYPNKDDKEAWEVALAIKDGKKMYDDDRRKPKGDYYIMSEEEIRAILKTNGFEDTLIKTLIQNNNNLAKTIHTEINLHQALFPNYDTADDIKKIYEEAKDGLVVKE